VITKSGTNEFHYGGKFVWGPRDWESAGRDSYFEDERYITRSFDSTDSKRLNAWASGPIVKDKLFFFAMYEGRDIRPQRTDDEGEPFYDGKSDDGFWGTTLDWQVTDNNLLSLMAFSNDNSTASEVFDFDPENGTRGAKIGDVFSFLMVSCDRLPPPDAYIATSGGQFKDQLIHDFDITRWLFGQEALEVTATGSTLGVPQYEAMGDVGTSAVLLRLSGGSLGLITGLRHNEAGYDIHVEVHGAKDTLAIGIDPRTPWRSAEADAPPLAGPAYPSFFVRFDGAYRAELAHFLRFARGEAENACTAADALEALRIAEAASRSYREKRTVKLAEIS